MLVKCRGCGNKIERDSAYKIKKGTANLYYCNEDEYKKIQDEKDKAKALKDKLQEIIDYIFDEPVVNTMLYKEISAWEKIRPINVVVEYLNDNKTDISLTLSKKSFESDYNKIRYFSAIVKNGVTSYKPQKQEKIRKVDVEIYETNYTPKPRRKCLADYEDGD